MTDFGVGWSAAGVLLDNRRQLIPSKHSQQFSGFSHNSLPRQNPLFADEGPVKVGEEEGRPPSHSSGYGSSQHIYGEVEERDGEGEEEEEKGEEVDIHLPQRGDIEVLKVDTLDPQALPYTLDHGLEEGLGEGGVGPFFLRVSPPPTTEEVGCSNSDGVVAFNPDFLARVEVGGRPLLLQQEEDSMVTRSLLELTSPNCRRSRRRKEEMKEGRDKEEVEGEKRTEDMEVVIQQLGRALTKTKGMSSLTKAVARGKGRGRRGSGRREEEERRRSGRREEERRKAAEVGRSRRGEERLGRRRREDRENSHRGGSGWRPRKEPVEVAGRGNWRLASPSPPYSNLLPSYPSPYSSLQTSTYTNLTYSRPLPPPPRARERLGSSLTLGEWGKAQLGREERKRRAAVVVCKSLCFLLLLTTFILVIVAVSVFLSKGRNHFGPM